MAESTKLDLSLNLATVRTQWKLPEAVAAAARHGFAGVAPWRDMVEETGVAQAARILKGSGLRVTGYCRGGLFAAAGPEKLATGRVDVRVDRALEALRAHPDENTVVDGIPNPPEVSGVDVAEPGAGQDHPPQSVDEPPSMIRSQAGIGP